MIVNSESGIVTVRATSRQHEKVAEFLASVMASARRQVLIEATVVEVVLNDNYQTGVDWSALGLNGLGYSFTQSMIGANMPMFISTSRWPWNRIPIVRKIRRPRNHPQNHSRSSR